MSKTVAVAPWMQTHCGRAFDLLAPQPYQIELADIAVSLDRLPRFNGHTLERPWTVAQHSHLVANLIAHVSEDDDPSLRLAALLHDAAEAYTGDITAPMKAALRAQLGYDPIKTIAGPIQRMIHTRFNLPTTLPDAWSEAIHQADLTALHIEKHFLMGPAPRPWVSLPPLPQDADGELNAVAAYHIAFGGFQQLVEKALEDIRQDA